MRINDPIKSCIVATGFIAIIFLILPYLAHQNETLKKVISDTINPAVAMFTLFYFGLLIREADPAFRPKGQPILRFFNLKNRSFLILVLTLIMLGQIITIAVNHH